MKFRSTYGIKEHISCVDKINEIKLTSKIFFDIYSRMLTHFCANKNCHLTVVAQWPILTTSTQVKQNEFIWIIWIKGIFFKNFEHNIEKYFPAAAPAQWPGRAALTSNMVLKHITTNKSPEDTNSLQCKGRQIFRWEYLNPTKIWDWDHFQAQVLAEMA